MWMSLNGMSMTSKRFIQLRLGSDAPNFHSEVRMLEHFNGLLRSKDRLTKQERHSDCQLVLGIDNAQQSELASRHLENRTVKKIIELDRSDLVFLVTVREKIVSYKLALKEEIVSEMETYLVARTLMDTLEGAEGRYLPWVRGVRNQDKNKLPSAMVDVDIGFHAE